MGSAHVRLGWIERRPAAGKLLLQPLVDTSLGELGRHPDAVIDGAVIGRAMVHDANAANAQAAARRRIRNSPGAS